MSNIVIEKSTLEFLKNLSSNNNRDWFNENRTWYDQSKENAECFMDALIRKMNTHDQLETPSGKKSLYRIFHDVRFSKNKSPYNPRFAGYLKRTKPMLRGGYYIWMKPGGSRIACGFGNPNAGDLKRMREDISANFSSWKKILRSKPIITSFGQMMGEQVKTVPRGCSSHDPAIELLRYKQFWFERTFTNREVTDPGFLAEVNKAFKNIRPFFDYASEVLTTNADGESLL